MMDNSEIRLLSSGGAEFKFQRQNENRQRPSERGRQKDTQTHRPSGRMREMSIESNLESSKI